MNAGEVIFRFVGDSKNLESSIKAVGNLGDKSASAVSKAFTTASKVVVGAVAGITAGLGTAIKRFDTLKNYPKILQNLGFSAEDAEKSINKLSKGIDGLPTSLDDAASGVQRLVAKNGDIDKSTEYFLALNDAIIAGNAPIETQKSAIEQLTQAYSKGKPDMMEWRNLMTAMPGQLKQVATAMGFIDTDQLGEALRSGKVSMDEFMDTLVEMDQTGIDGFLSFQEQAKNSCDSIGTAIANLGNRTKKGFATILGSIDSVANSTSFGSIAGMINSLSTAIKDALDKIGGALEQNQSFKIMMEQVATALTKVNEVVKGLSTEQADKLVTTFLGFMKVAPILGIVGSKLPSLVSGFNSLGKSANKGISSLGRGITAIAGSSSKLGAVAGKMGYVGLAIEGVTKALSFGAVIGTFIAGIGALDQATEGGLQKIADDIAEKLPELINKIVSFIGNGLPKILQAGVGVIKTLLSSIQQNLPTIISAINSVLQQLLQAVIEIAPQLTDVVVQLIVGFVNILITNLPMILQMLITVIVSLINSICQQLPTLLPVIVNAVIELIPMLINALISAIPLLLQAAIQLLMAIVQAIPTIITELVKALPTIITSIVTTLMDNYPTIMKAGFELLIGLVKAIPQITIELWKALPDIISTIIQSFKDSWPKIKESAKNMFNQFISGIGSMIGNIGAKVWEIISNIGSILGQLPGKAVQWGRDMIQGFADGIMQFANKIVEKVQGIAEKIKGFLHFSRPDEGPLRDYEKWMPDFIQGLTTSLRRAEPVLLNEVNSLASKMNSDFTLNGLDGEMSSIFDMSPTLYNTNTQSNSVNITIQNNMETDMLGNLVNNIKTYSNGSRQDFNYGIGG